ncbi:MAG: glycoside hydrolase family 3 C-terminal domain-containing protein [Eubacteriaceae bacterium]|nr:glycoside hydrolase family 3 C-terminal domain-containing protein [Eubacteriaceae bacterium]
MKLLSRYFSFTSIMMAFVILVCYNAAAQNKALPYQNTDLSFEERASDLISRLTLEEKVRMMQYDAPEIKRLSIPAYNWWNESLHGVARSGKATVFPQAIGMAATFDDSLIKEVATIISDEARAKHQNYIKNGLRGIYTGLTFWSPNINIFRDPRWGRGQETYGEDPYLTSRMGVNFIEGLQGNDPKYLKVLATAKHFAVHNGPEISRHTDNFEVSNKDLNETYLPAFKAAVNEAHVQSVMCAYNAFRGVPCCANNFLLEDVLRNQWHFKGYVVSDCGAIADFYREGAHKFVATPEEAAAEGVKNGTDLNCGTVYKNLAEATKKGLIDTVSIDVSVKKLLLARFKLGMFDPDEKVPYTHISMKEVASIPHIEKAKEIAQKSVVLLKNENHTLPLSKEKIKKMAVIGPNAASIDALYGNYNGISLHPVTPYEGIKNKLQGLAEVTYAPGCSYVEGLKVYEKIPENVLFADGSLTQHGLTGSYFKDVEFKELDKKQLDTYINFQWLDKMPVALPMSNLFSIRWEGYIVPKHTAKYNFKWRGNILINDNKVTGEILLQKGKKYKIELELRGNEMYDESVVPQANLTWSDDSRDYAKEAVNLAKNADVIIFCGGLSPRIEGEENASLKLPGFRYGDRSLLKLPDAQTNLLKKLNALGKSLIYVNISGSAVAFNWEKEHVPAIVQLFYSGEQGGNALADVLFGDYNPAGRLPVTFYKSVNDLGDFKDYSLKNKTYRYFKGKPLYPFGYGLSYSTFAYSHLNIEGQDASKPITIKVDVTNQGKMDGDEIVQVYYTVPGVKNQPLQSLCKFKRIHIPYGKTQQVTLQLSPNQLSYIDEAGDHNLIHGKVILKVGGGFYSEQTLTTTLQLQ